MRLAEGKDDLHPTLFLGPGWNCGACCRRRLCDDEDDLSEVAGEAVPSQVRDWLALTFTRSMSSLKRTAQDKPKFRSVANVIRAGIMVDRCALVFVSASK